MTGHTADEIIEAMARAIFGIIGETVVTWDDAGPMTRGFVREEARAAYAECLRMLAETAEATTSEHLRVSKDQWLRDRLGELG